jgi:hypothetical protein
LPDILSASYTLGHGITPGIITITIPLVEDDRTFSDSIGDVVFEYDGKRLVFRDCKLDGSSLEVSPDGYTSSLRIYDRRWRWQFGYISGWYNVRRIVKGNDIQVDREQSPRRLAKFCLEAMGENLEDGWVADLPDFARPQIDWDYDNPAQQLATLVEKFGCRVTLRTDNKIYLVKAGKGNADKEAPVNETTLRVSAGVSAHIKPGRIVVVGDRAQTEVDLPLEAVGEDTDGSIKRIDDLSYAPPNGWGDDSDIEAWASILGATGNFVAHAAARKSVYKWYRIKEPILILQTVDNGGLTFVVRRRDILPILDHRVAMIQDVGEGYRPAPALVYGVWTNDLTGDQHMNELRPIANPIKLAKTRYGDIPVALPIPKEDRKALIGSSQNRSDIYTHADQGFTIDTERGMVRFHQCVYRMSENKAQAAELALRVAINWRGFDGDWQHGQKPRVIAQGEDTLKIVKRPDLLHWRVHEYNEKFKPVALLATNQADFNRQCDHYLDDEAEKLRDKQSRTVIYAGLSDAEISGAVNQITWNIGPSGTTTVVSFNDERIDTDVSYAEKRLMEKVAEGIGKLERIDI